MKRNRTTLFAVLLLAGTLISGWTILDQVRFGMQPESKIWVDGTSSIHDWTCEVNTFTGSLLGQPAGTTLESLSSVDVEVPVSSLECKNGTMDKKARKAFNDDEYPTIKFTLKSAEVLSGTDTGFKVKAMGKLSMAGTTNDITLEADATALENGGYRFTGSTPLVMSDYGMDPPTAMFGTLKTGDEVVVNFDIVAAQ